MIFPWQHDIWQSLQRLAEADRLPHALLFTGMSGIGKLHLAEEFTRAILCQQPTPFATDCGTCHACRLFAGRAHPNVLWIEPEKTGQAIKVDQIRSITDFLNHSALQGKYRVVIIQPANNMNLNAANALLKTLEEPSANAIIILIGDQSDRLPATVLSRCRRLPFAKPDEEKALLWLQKEGISNAELLLKLANGAPLQAKRLAHDDALPLRVELFKALHQLSGKQADPLKLASDWQDKEPLVFIDLALSFVMDVLRLQCGSETIVNHDYRAQLNEVKQSTVLKKNEQFMNYLQQLRRDNCVGINFNKQLMLESAFIRWMACQAA